MITRRKLFEMIPPVAAAVALPAAIGATVAGANTGEIIYAAGPWLGDIKVDHTRCCIWNGERWVSDKEMIERGWGK